MSFKEFHSQAISTLSYTSLTNDKLVDKVTFPRINCSLGGCDDVLVKRKNGLGEKVNN